MYCAGPDAFASIERVLLLVVDGFDQNDALQGTPQLRYVAQTERPFIKPLRTSLSKALTCVLFRAMTPRTSSAMLSAEVPHADGWVDAHADHVGRYCCSCREVPRIWSRYARSKA